METIMNLFMLIFASITKINWPGSVKEKGRQAQYRYVKNGINVKASVDFGEIITLAEAQRRLIKNRELSPHHKVDIYRFR